MSLSSETFSWNLVQCVRLLKETLWSSYAGHAEDLSSQICTSGCSALNTVWNEERKQSTGPAVLYLFAIRSNRKENTLKYVEAWSILKACSHHSSYLRVVATTSGLEGLKPIPPFSLSLSLPPLLAFPSFRTPLSIFVYFPWEMRWNLKFF